MPSPQPRPQQRLNPQDLRKSSDVHGPAGVFDEEQDVDPFEERGVDVEQITCPDPDGPGFEELAPGRAVAPGCGIQAGRFEDVACRTGRCLDPGPFRARR